MYEDREEQQKEQQKEYERKRDRELNDLRKVLRTPEGRRVIWRLLEEAKIFQSVFTGNSGTYYKAGYSDFGRFILSEVLEANKNAFTQMMNEAWSERSQTK